MNSICAKILFSSLSPFFCRRLFGTSSTSTLYEFICKWKHSQGSELCFCCGRNSWGDRTKSCKHASSFLPLNIIKWKCLLWGSNVIFISSTKSTTVARLKLEMLERVKRCCADSRLRKKYKLSQLHKTQNLLITPVK